MSEPAPSEGKHPKFVQRISQADARLLREQHERRGRVWLIGAGVAAFGAYTVFYFANQKSPDPAPALTSVTSAGPGIARQAEDLWERVRVTTALCEQGREALAKEAREGGDPVRLYEVAARAKSTCSEGRFAIVALEPPEGTAGPMRDEFTAALNECRTAANFRYSTISKAAKIIDGDDKPSAVAGYRETQEFAEMAQAQCEAKLRAAVEAVGGKVPS